MSKHKKINKDKVLRFLLIESIKEIISRDIANTNLRIKDLEMKNKTFRERVLRIYILKVSEKFSLEEIEEFLTKELD